MNYAKHYNNLITKAKNRTSHDGYYEVHHIIPRCIGGTDDKDNLVKLTPEEHYVAHQLLVKIYPNDNKLIRAAMMMIPNRPSNKLYGWLKRKYSIIISEAQTGEGNSQFGTRWIHSQELKKSKKINKGQDLPLGWNEGRKIDFNNHIKYCKYCNNTYNTNTKIEFCSDKCKKYYLYPSIKIIDDNLEEIIELFIKSKSITASLKKFNLSGRQGNAYLSTILKNRGYDILKRRNS
jgi:hypothetical protein